MEIKNGAYFSTDTFGNIKGADIKINALESVDISGGTIRAGSIGARASASAGTLSIQGTNVTLRDNTVIHSQSKDGSSGTAGNVKITASESVIISDAEIANYTTGVKNAGKVEIISENVLLAHGAKINAYTEGKGDAGRIAISANDSIVLQDNASITTETRKHEGEAGEIVLAGSNIRLTSNASISSSTESEFDKARAGMIHVKSSGSVFLSDNASIRTEAGNPETNSEKGKAQAGNINMEVAALHLENRAEISSESNTFGNAGTISIAGKLALDEEGNVLDIIEPAGSITLKNNSSVTTNAKKSGGGKINIHAEKTVYVSDSNITSDVLQGTENGGDIRIGNTMAGTGPEMLFLDNSKITANADKGDGGAIFIITDNYLKSSNSKVKASSDKGNDGTITIQAPDVDISSNLAMLPSTFIDASRWMKTPCKERVAENAGRFAMTGRDGIPFAFDDWIPGQMPVLSYRMSEKSQQAGALLTGKGDFAGLAELLEKEEPLLWEGLALFLAYSSLGHYRDALDILGMMKPLAEKEDDLPGTAMYYNCVGDFHLLHGNMKQAIINVKKGLKKARLSRDPLITASVLINLGNLRSVGRNYRGAVKAYQESIELARDFENGYFENRYSEHAASLISKAMINMARAEFEMENIQDGARIMEQIPEQIRNRAYTFDKAADLVSFSLLARKISLENPGQNKTPDTWLRQAAQIGEKIQNHRLISCAYGYLGQYYEERNQYPEALDMTRKAVFYAGQGYYPEILYRWHWQTGRLFRGQGRIEEAVKSYRSAITALNPIRMEFFTGYRGRGISFDKDVRPVYLGLAELLLEQETTTQDAERLYEARDAVEMLKKAELEDFFHDECLTALRKETPANQVQLPPGTAVIYPIPLPEYLSLLVIFPGDIKQVRVSVSAATLGRTAKQFREQLETMDEDFREQAAQLYDWLIRPAESEFASRNISTLIIAPDGPLRLIPFSALHSREHFLVEKYALGTVPAINLADIEQAEQTRRQILLNGLSEPRQGYPGLENVKKELDAVSKIMDSKTLLDREFTVTGLEDEIKRRDYGMVHMATHAVFGSTPEDTFLVTYDGRLTMDRLDRVVGMKKYQDRQLELLALSACQTAVGDERAAFGLAGVALRAGAKSALATLWKTDDKAAYMIVDEFYRQLAKTGVSKAKALQAAQKKMINHEQLDHPTFWAPFLLIGNWL